MMANLLFCRLLLLLRIIVLLLLWNNGEASDVVVAMDSSLSVGFDGVLMIFCCVCLLPFCKTKEELECNGNKITPIQTICCSKALSCRRNCTTM